MGGLPAVSSLPSATPRRSGADLLRTIAAGTAASVGTAFLRSLVRHVAEALDAEIAFAAEVDEGAWERARVLASHGRDGSLLTPSDGVFAIALTLLAVALPEAAAGVHGRGHHLLFLQVRRFFVRRSSRQIRPRMRRDYST